VKPCGLARLSTGPGKLGLMEPSRLEPPRDLVDLVCPRCAAAVSERLYGPCSSCRDVLRATMGGEQSELVTADYVPKMNVTPNAVASKDE